MTGTDSILAARDDGVVTLTINRPERRNSIDLAGMIALGDHLERLTADPDVRCVVLTGAGESFCSGADLGGGGPKPAGDKPALSAMEATARVIGAIAAAPFPVIARVHGPAAGVGASFAFASDLVVATSESYFLLPFTGLGLIPDGGATLTVAAAVGRARAMRLALLRERFGAQDAYDAGLIAAVCDPAELDGIVSTWTATLTASPAAGVSGTKAAINAQTFATLTEALDTETRVQNERLSSPDFAAAVAAFATKKKKA